MIETPRLAEEHELFNRIGQMAPMCAPILYMVPSAQRSVQPTASRSVQPFLQDSPCDQHTDKHVDHTTSRHAYRNRNGNARWKTFKTRFPPRTRKLCYRKDDRAMRRQM